MKNSLKTSLKRSSRFGLTIAVMLLLLAMQVFTIPACAEETAAEETTAEETTGSEAVIAVQVPKLNKTKATLKVGKKLALKLTGAKAEKWTTSNKTIATVSSKGIVTARKAGTVTIRAITSEKKYACKITVKNPAKLNKASMSIAVGKSASLKVKNVTGKVAWKSQNRKIAKVNAKGKVTAVKIGTTKIFATVYGKKLTCKVTVTEDVLMPKSNIAAWTGGRTGGSTSGNEFKIPDSQMYQVKAEVSGRVQLNPYHMYYKNNCLYAECFIINGLSKKVTSIEYVYVRLLRGGVKFAEAGFGVVNDFGSIPPHGIIKKTFCFPADYAIIGTDLTALNNISWKWNNKLKYD